MKRVYGVAGFLVIGLLAGCGSSTEPRPAAEVTSDATPDPSPSVEPTPVATEDCDPNGDMSQAEWMEFCSGAEPDEAEGDYEEIPAKLREMLEAAPPESYWFEYSGAWGVVETQVAADDPRVADLEEYRQRVGAPEVTYAVARIDNSEGYENINMYGVTVIDEAGQQFAGEGATTYISEWQDFVDTDAPGGVDDYNDGIDLSSEFEVYYLPGAVGEAVMVFDEDFGTPGRVHVEPAGAGAIEAYPVEDAL